MAYQLNEEQNMIQAMVRDLAREVILPTAAERDKTGEFPAENIKKMGELGLMGMNLPPEYNGAGVDTVSYSVALQEIAYACASTAGTWNSVRMLTAWYGSGTIRMSLSFGTHAGRRNIVQAKPATGQV